MNRCNTCQGTYEPIQPDGAEYYHTCPPIAGVTVTRGGQRLEVPIAQLQPTDTVTVIRGKQRLEVPVNALQPDDERVGDVSIARPNARDENITALAHAGKAPRAIKAEGAGSSKI
jgi:hypothetical protein